MSKHFFEEQKEQSLVKARIVAKYFSAWAKVIISTQKRHPRQPQKIAYIDLFAGPGRYKDGSDSTPLKILTMAVNDTDLRERLVSIFNDKDEQNVQSLRNTIFGIPGIKTLAHEPQIYNQEVGEGIVKMFEQMRLVPTFFFVDPWGYKGLSLRLINSVLKDWGCDAVFFFNYNRINMGLNNEAVQEHIQALFGKERMNALKAKLEALQPAQREFLIVEELCQALREYGNKFVLPFRFRNEVGKRTSHHLIFVSKHFRGYEIMKDVMAKESTSDEQGVASFQYNPADLLPQQGLLFQLSRPLDDLRGSLLKTFKGESITMARIYEEHSVDTPYIKKNYKDVLRALYDEKIIQAIAKNGEPPRQGTFADSVMVTFPR